MKRLETHESRQRGSPDFPLEYHELTILHPRYRMPHHWHEECELLYVRSGSFDLVLDSRTHHLEAGDVAFIAGESLHGGEPQDCVYECIVFDMRRLLKCNDHCRQLLGDVFSQRLHLPEVMHAAEPLAQAAAPVFEALRSQCPGWELLTLGSLFRLMGEAARRDAWQAAATGSEGRRVLQLKRVFELIESSYASRLTLADLAAAAHMTSKHFCRFFHAAVHRTPIDYLNSYRVEVACNLISDTDRPLTEIALDCGFGTLNYFIRQFRRYKGETPGAYRSRLNTER